VQKEIEKKGSKDGSERKERGNIQVSIDINDDIILSSY
jgi:hypothetical protein